VGHYTTERGVVAVLADDHVGEHAAAASHDRDAGVVAAGLDPEDVEPAARNARRKATASRHRHRVLFRCRRPKIPGPADPKRQNKSLRLMSPFAATPLIVQPDGHQQQLRHPSSAG
jgi:hypothetical protein